MSFTYFTKLPAELRLQIWIDALSGCTTMPPTAFPYRTECWESTMLEDTGKMRIGFRHENLARISITTPLLSVCHEARATALSWLSKQKGIHIQDHAENPSIDKGKGHSVSNNRVLTVSKSFDPFEDVLYIPITDFGGFIDAADRYLNERPENRESLAMASASPVCKLAIHAESMWDAENRADLAQTVQDWFLSVDWVFMVVDLDEKPDLNIRGGVFQDRWTFDALPKPHECCESSGQCLHYLAMTVEDAMESAASTTNLTYPHVRTMKMRKQ